MCLVYVYQKLSKKVNQNGQNIYQKSKNTYKNSPPPKKTKHTKAGGKALVLAQTDGCSIIWPWREAMASFLNCWLVIGHSWFRCSHQFPAQVSLMRAREGKEGTKNKAPDAQEPQHHDSISTVVYCSLLRRSSFEHILWYSVFVCECLMVPKIKNARDIQSNESIPSNSDMGFLSQMIKWWKQHNFQIIAQL